MKLVATRCQILRLKCTKLDFGWGYAPHPAEGVYSAPPNPVAGLRDLTSKGKGKKRGGEGKEEGGNASPLHSRGGQKALVNDTLDSAALNSSGMTAAYIPDTGRRHGVAVSGVPRMNQVNPRRARLLEPTWMGDCLWVGYIYHLGMLGQLSLAASLLGR